MLQIIINFTNKMADYTLKQAHFLAASIKDMDSSKG
jgi:hypothetical protein